MILYDYRCPNCGGVFEALNSMTKRHCAVCPSCDSISTRFTRTAPTIDPRMGVDPDFPTMAKRWDKKQRLKATGVMKDSNNSRYQSEGSVDIEEGAHKLRRLYTK